MKILTAIVILATIQSCNSDWFSKLSGKGNTESAPPPPPVDEAPEPAIPEDCKHCPDDIDSTLEQIKSEITSPMTFEKVSLCNILEIYNADTLRRGGPNCCSYKCPGEDGDCYKQHLQLSLDNLVCKCYVGAFKEVLSALKGGKIDESQKPEKGTNILTITLDLVNLTLAMGLDYDNDAYTVDYVKLKHTGLKISTVGDFLFRTIGGMLGPSGPLAPLISGAFQQLIDAKLPEQVRNNSDTVAALSCVTDRR